MRKKNTKIFSYIAASILMLGAACGGEDNKETLDPIAVTPDAAPTGEEKEKEPSATPDITSTGGEKEEDPSATPDANPPGEEKEKEPSEITYTKLTITEDMITSSMPWNNGSDVAANAFDGDVSTFFDGLEEGYIRVDLGGEYLIGKVGYAPRSGYESRLSGTFYGSLDGRTWYEIYQIKSAPSSMKETDYTEFSTVGRFRYVKYENINDCANISEMVLYAVEGIPSALVTEIERETYADGTYETLDEIPQDRGMIQAGFDVEEIDDLAKVVCDNNPSTVAKTDEGEAIVLTLDREYTLSAIAYMGGADDEISPADLAGGQFYGSADKDEWDLI